MSDSLITMLAAKSVEALKTSLQAPAAAPTTDVSTGEVGLGQLSDGVAKELQVCLVYCALCLSMVAWGFVCILGTIVCLSFGPIGQKFTVSVT